MPKLTSYEESVIQCAYLDLAGSYQTREGNNHHDWEAHAQSIMDLECAFPFIDRVDWDADHA